MSGGFEFQKPNRQQAHRDHSNDNGSDDRTEETGLLLPNGDFI
ncbi:hypothetical protein [Thiocapsa bogorovii]|nr:hypothetical protein [Thiocapsa bogorovii]